MDDVKLTINTITNGRFTEEKLNGRDHIVTRMIPIVGDSVMNGGLYPDSEVEKSFSQLNMLPAPNDHPRINGTPISAFHPLAINANNFGGFIRNPVKSGKKVEAELWLDVEVANKTADGKELIRRIKTAENVGVSTGLTAKKESTTGMIGNKSYTWKGSDYKFDHVAILLNDSPAGDETKLLLNTEIPISVDDVYIVNSRETINNEEVEMSKKKEDKKDIDEKKVDEKVDEKIVNEKKLTPAEEIEAAVSILEAKGFVVNTKDKDDELQYLIENKDKIKALFAKEDEKKSEMVDAIVTNSKMTKEDFVGMSETMVQKLFDTVVPMTDNSFRSGGIINRSEKPKFKDSYAPDYSGKGDGEK